MLLKTNETNPNIRYIRMAINALEAGGLVAYATDTNYGLGCDIGNKKAMERALSLKGYSKHHQLSFLCADLSDISKYARVDTPSYKIMKRCLPGPFTFVLPATHLVPRMMLTRRKTVGIRVPDHPVAHTLLAEFGRPILSTGVTDRSGEVMNDPDLIEEVWGSQIDIILDSGVLISESSTVVDLTSPEGPIVLREGKGELALLR